jgi:nicotinamidase-related amidase
MRSALLVIDVQRGLFDPEPRPDQADTIVTRINGLTSRARSADVPVIFIHHETRKADLEYGSAGWTLESRLRVEAGDHLVRKTTPDSFLRTDLEELLTALEISHIVVCGYATEFCVDSTVRRAAGLGFAVTIAADAHTTHDKPHASAENIRAHHNATLPNIVSFGPKIEAVRSDKISFPV